MAQAIAEAALITFVPLLLLKGGPGDYGSEVSFFFFGGTTFTLVVLLANSKVIFFFPFFPFFPLFLAFLWFLLIFRSRVYDIHRVLVDPVIVCSLHVNARAQSAENIAL